LHPLKEQLHSLPTTSPYSYTSLSLSLLFFGVVTISRLRNHRERQTHRYCFVEIV
jgi:hypothetical protein